MKREKFASRLGFVLVSAGCAIGLGNVWRFPYITGKYGGSAFVLLYLLFLAIMGIPILVMELSVGRASQASIAVSFDRLEKPGQKWHFGKYIGMVGNYLLMSFYTVIGGWMIYYCVQMATGKFENKNSGQVAGALSELQGNTGKMTFFMVLIVVLCFGVCAMGVQKGVEKVTKIMMLFLLVLMAILAVKTLSLPGGKGGLNFFLKPDFKKMFQNGWAEPVYAAMGQAFFTLGIGVGSMAIFGSYIGKERSLMGEAITITALDTVVAIMAGVIIFPACFAFGIEPDAGPSLIFITLPNVFNSMSGGRIWGTLFFVFLTFAAMSTIIAIFENIVSFAIDAWGWSRKKAVLCNLILIIVVSMPCILGFHVWKGFEPLGKDSNVMDLEDFIMSDNILPIGCLIYLLFCTQKFGWGWKNFIQEANEGKGMKFPAWSRFFVTCILPIIVLIILVKGYLDKF